ncbi:MAG: phosphatidylglycerol lysyltransferase domain-containing protein [Lachnospiraceae bacterium]|nr:phosphatidylglycerol lysyltransferase domain-containing protein [Lachnospiraceae bacterium]
MSLDFKPIEVEDIEKMTPFFCLRPNKTCDSVFLDSFIWREFYHVQYAISDGKALQWMMEEDGVKHSAMPMCKEEDLPYYFNEMKDYFNQVLKVPFKIYLADEEAVEYLHLRESEEFVVTEQEDLKDYLYDGDAMRALSGKKLHKKKNHLNGFLKEYEGRYEFRRLCCSDRGDVWKFLDRWRETKGEEAEAHLDYEVRGIHEILKNCSYLQVKMSGVYIDGQLEAFTIGTYNPLEEMAVIHIEKANPEIRGLYQFINQQFLIHEFPDAKLINREDDLGQEGLRHAKMSYNPCGFARKYLIEQRGFTAAE